MTQPTPLEPFVLTFPRDEDGKDIKYRFMLTLSKKLKQSVGKETIESRLVESLGTLDGIDGIGLGVGRYTLEVTIARTFDPDVVIAELKNRLTNNVLSDIIRSPLVVPA